LKWTYRDCHIEPDDWTDPNGVHPYEFVNYNAVLNAYRRGDIKVVDDQATVWFAGRMTIGPIHLRELDKYDLDNKMSE